LTPSKTVWAKAGLRRFLKILKPLPQKVSRYEVLDSLLANWPKRHFERSVESFNPATNKGDEDDRTGPNPDRKRHIYAVIHLHSKVSIS
jgi:hypothetical protein